MLKLILYAPELPRCSCYEGVFRDEFDTIATTTEQEFLRQVQHMHVDAAVLCCCAAQEEKLTQLLQLEARSSPIPTLLCTRNYNPNFVRLAAQQGVDHFLLCDMDTDKIRQIVLTAVENTGLRQILESSCPNNRVSSPHVSRMIKEIMNVFPRRFTTGELSARLGISNRRLQMICQEHFRVTFTQLIRRICIYLALTLMQKSNLDNLEIAMQLDYGDASSLTRAFRKELGCTPSEARHQLARPGCTPADMLLKQ